MKIIFLLAGCTLQYLQDSIAAIAKVLKELDVEIEMLELNILPYFNGMKTMEMDKIVQAIESSKGIVAVTHVPMLSIHGAMQTFFDSSTLYHSEQFDKPILAITYSEWLGEVEAADKILKNWSIIGGAEGQKICLNKNVDFKSIVSRLERAAEDFYRIIKQDRQGISSTERQIYNYLRTGQALDKISDRNEEKTFKEEVVLSRSSAEIKSFVDILKQGNKHQESKDLPSEPIINLSTKEQTIKEIAHLLKKQVADEDSKQEDQNDKEFTAMNAGVYKKPIRTHLVQPSIKRLPQIPHYFIAKYDKNLNMVLKYSLINSNEEGFIVIKDGDCEYKDDIDEMPLVEFILTEEVLKEILSKKVTYQKAFMLGKLKVKGNFSILPKLDQIFTSI
jgi:putative sterol carrier protein/multimeric flavodoxin WrbA